MATSLSGDPLHWAKAYAHRHWLEDGLTDIVVGGYLVLYGILFELSQQKGLGLTLLFIAVVLILAWRMRAFIHYLKARWVYPRAGYMRPRRPSWEQRLVGSTVVLVVLVLLIVGLTTLGVPDWMLACGLTTAFFTAAFIWAGWRYRMWRYVVLAGLNALMLVWLVLAQPTNCRATYPLVTNGVLLLLAGTLTFVQFMQRHPLPQGDMT
ncbi:MAG: hypothetical protein GXO54_04005 [Chloroflexi bacterium]|nr:hypothetical protein [Chloroflexota bacterium]